MKVPSVVPTFGGTHKVLVGQCFALESSYPPYSLYLGHLLLSHVLGNTPLNLPLEWPKELAPVVAMVIMYHYAFVLCINVHLISPLNFNIPKKKPCFSEYIQFLAPDFHP